MVKKEEVCCGKKRFPTFGAILLAIGVIWLLNDLEVVPVDLPWVPIVVIVIAIGLLINHKKHIK